MGCCSFKSNQSQATSSLSSLRNIDDDSSSFNTNKTFSDMSFFMAIPNNECRKFLKYVKNSNPQEMRCILDLDSEILACSGQNMKKTNNSSPFSKNLRRVNSANDGITQQRHSISNNTKQKQQNLDNSKSSDNSQRKGENIKREDHQKIIDKVISKQAQYINLKQSELKLQLISADVLFGNEDNTKPNKPGKQNKKLHQIKLVVSVTHNKTQVNQFQFSKNITKIQSQSSIITLQLDRYLSFVFPTKNKTLTDAQYYQNSFILFEIYIQKNIKSEYEKVKEQKICLEELLQQNLITHSLKFFREEEMNNDSQMKKFDLVLRAQLIHNSKHFLEETLKDAEIQKHIVHVEKEKHKKIMKSKLQKEQIKQKNNQQNISISNSANDFEEDIKTKGFSSSEGYNQTPLDLYTNYFFNVPSENNPSSNIKTPKSQIYNNNTYNNNSCNYMDLQENQSRVSVEYVESYSCQFNNIYAMREDDGDEIYEADDIQAVKTANQLDQDDGNNTELLSNKYERNNSDINIPLFKSMNNQDEESDISQIKELINQSTNKNQSPTNIKSDSVIKQKNCLQIIEQEEQSSIDEIESYYIRSLQD